MPDLEDQHVASGAAGVVDCVGLTRAVTTRVVPSLVQVGAGPIASTAGVCAEIDGQWIGLCVSISWTSRLIITAGCILILLAGRLSQEVKRKIQEDISVSCSREFPHFRLYTRARNERPYKGGPVSLVVQVHSS